MKSKLLFLFAGFAISSLCAFSAARYYEVRSNTAEVEQLQGLYIFTDSKPVQAYDYLGTEKGGMNLSSGQYTAIRDRLIKKVKKEYPKANGVILQFQDGGTDRADAIFIK